MYTCFNLARQYKRHPGILPSVFIALSPRVSPRLLSGTTSRGHVYKRGIV